MRPLCTDPHAAYALGMVTKMMKSHAASSSSPLKSDAAVAATTTQDGGEPLVEKESRAWQEKLGKLQFVMESPRVDSQKKQVLVELIEDAATLQDVWAYVDAVSVGDASDSSETTPQIPKELEDGFTSKESSVAHEASICQDVADVALDGAASESAVEIPMELGCAICCADLMLKPASLSCGHSFCKYCLELWLKNCSSCPTCRHPTTNAAVSVNLALQQVIHTFYPKQIQALEEEDQTERFEQLRVLIRHAVESGGNDLHEILARLPHSSSSHAGGSNSNRRNRIDQSLAVSLILESDVELQERVLAAEIRERLRKERLLRESSRRRHMAAYNTTSLSAQVDPAILNMNNNLTSTSTVRRSSVGGGKNANFLTSFLGRKGS